MVYICIHYSFYVLYVSLWSLQAEITAVLRRMYGKDIPEPQAIHCTKWHSNPLTFGAFHCLRYGSTLSDLESLSRPVNSLHFAGCLFYVPSEFRVHKYNLEPQLFKAIKILRLGDGTAIKFTGCVNGAYNTGVQQARAVFEKINGPITAL